MFPHLSLEVRAGSRADGKSTARDEPSQCVCNRAHFKAYMPYSLGVPTAVTNCRPVETMYPPEIHGLF